MTSYGIIQMIDYPRHKESPQIGLLETALPLPSLANGDLKPPQITVSLDSTCSTTMETKTRPIQNSECELNESAADKTTQVIQV